MRLATPNTTRKSKGPLDERVNADQRAKVNINMLQKTQRKLKAVRDNFHEELLAEIEAGGMMTQALIGPDEASILLRRNTNNRPLRAGQVELYSKQMSRGEWRYTRVPVIVSKGGVLIDGQHRLSAVVHSGTHVEMDVACGAPDEAFSFIDIGKKRSNGDIFGIHGVKNATMMAGAMNWVIAYVTGVVAMRGKSGLTAAQLYEEYQKHTDMQNSAYVGYLFNKNKLASPSLMTAMHYLAAQKNRAAADAFFTRVAEGIGLEAKAGSTVLRAKLISNAASDEKMSNRKVAGLTVRAFNAERSGHPVGTLKYKDGAPLPRFR